MNEHELKSALQDAMVASSPPPPMSAEGAVAAGRAAQRRRKAAWTGGVAGVAVVAIAVGAVLVPQLTGGGSTRAGGPPLTTGAPPSATADPSAGPTTGEVTATDSVDPSASKPEWPDGQTDRTARSGARADKSVQVLNDLGASLPPTFQAVDKQSLVPEGDPDTSWYGPMRYTQSQFDDYYDGGKESWEYMGTSPVTQQGTSGVGKVWVLVLTKGNRFADVQSPCEAKQVVWTIDTGDCVVRTVGGKQVGHLTAAASARRPDLDEAAIFRHDDGTLVVIGQAKEFRRTGHPALSGLPFTADQLTTLVTDEKFHLD
ncbi:hypothetical protein GCM10010492_29730 [Saccharothrix mutabilis subsp. mutabilis]|uniref:Uncharacterized protein n=1 Tax=Saccharothrix mutabilis subsp. mutabilis TaxID=66855 RepID=A0ABP3DCX8_9PSEU